MATVVNKDFKVKNGLIVEGTTGTIDNYDILTKKPDDQSYIIGLIGGAATSENTPDTVVLRDGSGNFAANDITANEISIGEIGRIYDDGDLIISNTDGQDVIVEGEDIRLNSQDDVRLSAGVGGNNSGDIVLGTPGKIRLEATDVFLGTDFNYPDSNRVATKGHVSDELANYTTTANLDSTVGSYGYLKSADLSGYATESYVDTAEADAVATAAADATSKANAAEAAANSYTDDEISALDLSLKAYADQAESDAIATAATDATNKANAAEDAANLYTDGEISSLDSSLRAYADTAEADAISSANSYTDAEISALDTSLKAYADQAEVDAKAYADTAVANLVNGAPELLNTLNELAEAIGDDANFVTTVTTSLGLKADITYVDSEIADINTDAQGYADAAEDAANAYTDAREIAITSAYQSYADTAEADAISAAATDATTKANAAENNAKAYTDAEIAQEVADRNSAISSAINTEITDRNTAINAAITQEVTDRNSAITTAVNALTTSDIEEGTNLYFTNQRAIDAVGGTIGDAIDELTTDDIEEGFSNLYFTDSRAKGSAGDLLAGAITSNVDITYVDGILSITAENGVADSTTSDLAEGSNLYFTDARAVSALEAVTPDFPAVEIASVAKQVAAQATVATASTSTAVSWAKADFRSAEFLVKIANGTHTEVSKVILTLDTSDNVAMTEYAMVGTNGSLGSVSADVSGNDVRLRVTTANNNSTVAAIGTLLK